MDEPCFEIQCSYEAVETVIDHILEKTGIGNGRQWKVLGCDGLPSRIVQDVHCSTDCAREFCDVSEFKNHVRDFEHSNEITANHCRKYKDIIMIPGLGHYKINMTKALCKLLWNVGLADLAKMLGFVSPKALASCQSCTSWYICNNLEQNIYTFSHLTQNYVNKSPQELANPSDILTCHDRGNYLYIR
ncbi:hypothetical protein KUTeg_022291 [Tegillarca granosa]|uniref:C2H2-type domain-containing protein n=1 Tax=Tegillarca granosa TaxID=220873 RepID=A0ABQ9E660_TEGGR|nr:hypothetical protein KUTeg_022291 [Tegillarca granosa]